MSGHAVQANGIAHRYGKRYADDSCLHIIETGRFSIKGKCIGILQTLQPQEYAHDTEVEKQHDNRCQPIESTPILLGLIIEG